MIVGGGQADERASSCLTPEIGFGCSFFCRFYERNSARISGDVVVTGFPQQEGRIATPNLQESLGSSLKRFLIFPYLNCPGDDFVQVIRFFTITEFVTHVSLTVSLRNFGLLLFPRRGPVLLLCVCNTSCEILQVLCVLESVELLSLSNIVKLQSAGRFSCGVRVVQILCQTDFLCGFKLECVNSSAVSKLNCSIVRNCL